MDMYIRSSAAKAALRLRETQSLKQSSWGHSTILRELGDREFDRTTDYIKPVTNFQRTFRIRIPSREDWTAGSVIQGNAISVFTDGSKMEMGTGSGVYSEDLDIRVSMRLPDECSVFQAEIYAIDTAARIIRERDVGPTVISIFVDSLAALKALGSYTIRSKCFRDCVESLGQIQRHEVCLTWVPAHTGIMGNELADECARKGSESVGDPIQTDVLIPMVGMLNRIEDIRDKETKIRWASMPTCRIARTLWTSPDPKRTKSLLGFGKRTIGMLIGVLTGHCAIGRMATRWGYSRRDYCGSRGDEEETVEHLLCECPRLKERRLRYLGSRFFEDLDSLSDVNLSDLADFLRESKWFG